MILESLNEELAALSELQREAVILRYLQGLSEKEAAAKAGCTSNTLSRRASDGISRLRTRLVKRGCTLGFPALIGVLATESQAAVPETLIPSLMAVPKLVAAGAAAGTASANIIFLMEGALKAMAIAKIKMAGTGILIALLIGTTGVMAVREIQKRQTQDAIETPDILASPAKQKVDDHPKSSKNDELASTKLETKGYKGKTQSAKVTQPPKARNFKAEMEEAFSLASKLDFSLRTCEKMTEWLDYDKDGAIEWTLRMRGQGFAQMQILQTVPSWRAEKDPVAASGWAMKLPEGKNTNQSLNNIVTDWAGREPDNARNWIEKSSLSQDEKDKLLKLIPKK